MSKFSFYSDKPNNLPRRIYRHLAARLQTAATQAQRSDLIGYFIEELKTNHARGEYMRMRLTVGSRLAEALTAEENDTIEKELALLRAKRGSRVHPIYPLCSDEFKFGNDFFTSVFKDVPEPTFNRQSRIFTIGSCFAVNIANHLSRKGFNITSFKRAEDINSIFGNALLFTTLIQDDDAIEDFVRSSVSRLIPDDDKQEAIVTVEVSALKALKNTISGSDVIVLTMGNTIDAFYDTSFSDFQSSNVFPRFLNMFQDQSISAQTAITRHLKNLGGTFRLAGTREALPAIQQMFESLTMLNPSAPIFATVSPVAIHNTMGLSTFGNRGPVEADCATKSILRACIEDVLASPTFSNVRYFPSFEIVRWLGSAVDQATFGTQDSASTHVSDNVLESIFEYFEFLYAEEQA